MIEPENRARSQAGMWMAGSVILSSLYPLAVAMVGLRTGAYAFLFWHNTTVCVTWLLILIRVHPTLLRTPEPWRQLTCMLRTRDGALASLGGCSVLFFVWATHFVDTALVAVTNGGWLLLFVIFQKRSDQRKRYTKLGAQGWGLITAGLLGATFVTLSQTGGIGTTTKHTHLLIGLLLAGVSTGCGAFVAHKFKLGTLLHSHTNKQPTHHNSELGCTLAASVISDLPGAVLGLVLAATIPATETVRLFPPGTGWVILFASAAAVGSAGFRHANLTTQNLGINTLQYLRPCLALLWLSLFATVNVTRPDWLLLGAAGVTVTVAATFQNRNSAQNLKEPQTKPHPQPVPHKTRWPALF